MHLLYVYNNLKRFGCIPDALRAQSLFYLPHTKNMALELFLLLCIVSPLPRDHSQPHVVDNAAQQWSWSMSRKYIGVCWSVLQKYCSQTPQWSAARSGLQAHHLNHHRFCDDNKSMLPCCRRQASYLGRPKLTAATCTTLPTSSPSGHWSA